MGFVPRIEYAVVGRLVPGTQLIHAEIIFDAAPARVRVQLAGAGDGRGQFVGVIADEAGDTVLDHFLDRAAAQRHHRGAAGHGLDHHDAERLFPADGEQQAAGAREQFPFGDRVGFPEDVVGIGEQGLDLLGEERLLRRLVAFTGEDQLDPGLVRGA